MKKAVIVGTGKYVPERVVKNNYFYKLFGTSSDWIKQRTGIEQRYWIPKNKNIGSSDLGLKASILAIEHAGWHIKDIDLIIFATLSPDIFFPGSGCILQHKLGLKNTPALDIRQQCTGFIYGLATADAYIKSNIFKRILLVGSEVQSTGLDLSPKGRDIAVIFGDGAGAVCIEGIETKQKIGILSSELHADGSLANSLMTEAPSSKCNPRLDNTMLAEGKHFPYMDGKNIFKNAIKRLPKVAKNILAKTNLSINDIDLIIPHQANLRINQAFAKSLKVNNNKVFSNIEQYGNTTAASIPIALDDAKNKNIINNGDTVMFIGLGAGVTWGAVIHKFGYNFIK